MFRLPKAPECNLNLENYLERQNDLAVITETRGNSRQEKTGRGVETACAYVCGTRIQVQIGVIQGVVEFSANLQFCCFVS